MPRPSFLISLQTLEHVSRALLVRLLAPHADFAKTHGVPLDALAATAQNDRALVRILHTALHAEDSLPPPSDELCDRMLALSDLTGTKGRDELLALDTSDPPRLPRGTLGDEDLAATAILDAPEIAEDARVACSGTHADAAMRGVTELDPKEPRPFPADDAFRAPFVTLFGARMKARDRKDLCDLHRRETRDAIYLEIAHGRPPAVRDFVRGDSTLTIEQSTDVVTERARVRICKKTWRASLKASHAAIKEVLRRTLGEVAHADPDHWRADGAYSLAPFSDLASALKSEGVPDLQRVELHALSVLTDDGETMAFSRPRKSIIGASADHVHTAALALGKVVAVKLVLRIANVGAIGVKLTVRDGQNRIEYPRDNPEVERVVREYMIARGILRMAPAKTSAAVDDNIAGTG